MTTRVLTKEEVQTYQTDGVAWIPHALDHDWVDRLCDVAETQMADPSQWANDTNPGASRNRMFSDRYLWRSNTTIYEFIRDSGFAGLAAQAMDSASARFYFDHLFVKQPGTDNPTPWHQDAPYWPFRGRKICSIWLALTATNVASSSLEFIRGSQREYIHYLPKSFVEGDKDSWVADSTEGKEVPDIESNRDDFDIVGFELEPGDALIFSAWVLHGARSNLSVQDPRLALSTRWLGDDVTWDPREGTDPTVTSDMVCVNPGDRIIDNAIFPEF
ncbi:MAG: phytanoyl-CoA dioxygenase family protein [Pseudomonadota bacterium]